MSRIVWLASYPKSGSTWLRAFLANYRRRDDTPADLNALEFDTDASTRELFDELTGLESSTLTADEIDRYRPAVYRQAASESADTLLVKIHDAYTLTSKREPLVPADVSRGAIYILRNPLDVAVSFSHHSGGSIEQAIERMADEKAALSESARRLPRQLRQKLSSWSGHVLSWRDQSDVAVCLIRYEDLLIRPMEIFGEVVRFIGWEENPARISRAIELASFENLQSQEHATGFKEKPPGMAFFFRRGRMDSWRQELTQEQVAQLIRDHGAVMRRFGYLSQTGEILDLISQSATIKAVQQD